MQQPAYDLVIFDCDGVLVDSEMLSAQVLMQLLQEIGQPITFDTFREDFLGRSFAVATEKLQQRTGLPVPENFQNQYFDRLLALVATSLEAMPGVYEMLDAVNIPFCLASSSTPARLACTLKRCALEHYFTDRVFSSVLVKKGKPAPDLFLHVAKVMQVEPARCLVIEDSAMGIEAAHNAEMDVWHFVGGSHLRGKAGTAGLLGAGLTIADMAGLRLALMQAGICKPVGIAVATTP